jgi:hypothetical protein
MTARSSIEALERLADRGTPRGADRVLRDAADSAVAVGGRPSPHPPRHGLVLKVALVVLVAAVVAGLVAIGARDGEVSEPAAPPVGRDDGSEPAVPQRPGSLAVWTIDRSRPPSADSERFTALVRRVECSSGVTGAVRDPEVVEEGDRVVVRFTLDPLPEGEGYDCPGNPDVAVEVELEAPLGDRDLVDGNCQPVEGARCTSDGVRWPEQGRPAIWTVDPSDPPSAESTRLTALVQRVDCSGGVTGVVRDPEIVEEPGRVVITFTVDPLPERIYTCPPNQAVRVEVALSAPLGDRLLVDGQCATLRINPCPPDGARWPEPAG